MNPILLRYGGLALAFVAGVTLMGSSGSFLSGTTQTCSSTLDRPCFEKQTGKKLMQLSQKQGVQMLASCIRSSSGSQRGETIENTTVCADERVEYCNEGASSVVVKRYEGICKTASPVVVTYPNGGETLLNGQNYNITWSGGWRRTAVYLVKPEATNASDPSKLILGSVGASPYELDPLGAELIAKTMSLPWDAFTIATDYIDEWLYWGAFAPGNYKILVLSENDKGEMLLWDEINNKPGNWDVSDQPFTVVGR